MSQRTVLHHTVPRFYLRRFADYDEQLRALDKKTGRVFGPLSIAVLAAESNFHTIHVDGVPSDEVEKIVGERERIYAHGLRLLDEHFPPTDEVRNEVSQFIAFQFVRSTRWRDISLRVSARMLKQLAGMMASDLRHLIEPQAAKAAARRLLGTDEVADAEIDDLLEVIENEDYELEINPQEHVREMLQILRDPEPARIIAARSWSLLQSKHPAEFVTGDHPVALRGNDPLGIQTAAEICFPLDRRRALLLSWDDQKAGKRYEVGQVEVDEGQPRHAGCRATVCLCASAHETRVPDRLN